MFFRYRLVRVRRPRIAPAAIAEYKRQAKIKIPERVAFYAAQFGVVEQIRRIRIMSARRRWGSCSHLRAGGVNLNFTWRLMRVPPASLDYVVIHELAHITHKNHSRAFWTAVAAMYPDYREAKRGLASNS